MRQLAHDVRVAYIDNDDDIVQNCYNHRFEINTPSTYSSRSFNLVENYQFTLDQTNYLYVTAQYPIKVYFNGINEIECKHLSWINEEVPADVIVMNSDVKLLENQVQLLYGKSEVIASLL